MNLVLIVVAVVATVLLALFVLARRRAASRRRKEASARRPPPKVVEIRDKPDGPVGWGPKSWWIATRAPIAQALGEALQLDGLRPSNWESGLTLAESYPSDYVFVTPPITGWTLAVGVGLPDPGDPKLLPLWRSLMVAVSERFGEAWFFASQRACDYSVWARYLNGDERRLFAHEAFGVIYDYGEMLPEEADLVLPLRRASAVELNSRELDEVDWPGEDDLLRLAGAWTLDPSTIGSLDLPPSVGVLGRMPLGKSLDRQQKT